MKRTTSDVLVERLIDWGVDVVFGLPGDGINGIMEALRTHQDRIAFVQVRHEEAAAFMACGYAKYTGRLGVCLATSGPGAIHLLNGLYDAKMDGAPVLAITGQTYHDLIGTRYQQEVDLLSLFKDVAVLQPAGPRRRARARARRRRLPRGAVARRRRAHHAVLSISRNRRSTDDEPSQKKVEGHTSTSGGRRSSSRATSDVRAAADVLNAGKKTVILAGQGALGRGDELEQLADLMARSDRQTAARQGGRARRLAVHHRRHRPARHRAVRSRDGGVRHAADGRHELPVHGVLSETRSVPRRADRPRPVADRPALSRRGRACAATPGATLAGPDPAHPSVETTARSWRRRRSGMKAWRELMHTRAHRDDVPMKPQVVAHALERAAGRRRDHLDRLGHDHDLGRAAHSTSSAGSCSRVRATWRRMAPGLPYAIAAQIAYPGRQSVAFVGDGGFTMLMGEFATAVKYRPARSRSSSSRTTRSGMIKWEQMVFLGNPGVRRRSSSRSTS